MEPRAVFVDVDGTLVDGRGQIPQSAKTAIAQARRNGHLVFLCTGRSLSALWEEILEIGFDGIVAAAGGYVEVRGEVLVHHRVPVEEVQAVIDFFDSHSVDYLLECNEGLLGSPDIQHRMRDLFLGGVTDEDLLAGIERGLAGFLSAIVVGADHREAHVNKVSFLDSHVTLDEIRAEFADRFDIIPTTVPIFGANSGEMSLRGIHKAEGIRLIIEHLGMDTSRTIAFGDGLNDLEMIQYAGIGVAMGTGHPEVLALADDVTAGPDEDGIREGFARHGLI